jgi:hypothetical protein
MSATIRVVAPHQSATESASGQGQVSPEGPRPRTKRRRAWAPQADDHQIYQWIRFEGKNQHWVAWQMSVSQATVSRVIQRYERWKAHAEPRDGGELDPAERARAQRWLTYERNEIVIASALRLAGELEGFTDISKSVTRHPLHNPTQDSEVRRENGMIDRSGLVSRFLRIVHRVNMDQQKFVEQEPLPGPEPLSDEALAHEAAQAAEDRAEKQRNEGAREAHDNQCKRKDLEVLGDAEALAQFDEQCAAEAAERAARRAAEEAAEQAAEAEEDGEEEEAEEEDSLRLTVVGGEEEDSACRAEPEPAGEAGDGKPACEVAALPPHEGSSRQEEPTGPPDPTSGVFMQKLHKMHNADGENIAVSDYAASSWDKNPLEADFCQPNCTGSA